MYNKSATQIREMFVERQVSAVEIARYFLKRIETFDKNIGAFLKVLEQRVLSKAHALDEKRARGEPLGALAAIPIGIKDNIHIKGEYTTCASKFLSNYKAPFDATVTRLIDEADGLIIGKTNMDEFAMGSSNEHSAFQTTHNPWDLSCVPGGSSGGSAAAVAARLCPICLGSDTGGSIRQPAALTGTVGMKGSYGRISRYGLVAFASSLDQIGPIATCVEDAALMMSVLGTHCLRDATSLENPMVQTHFAQGLDQVKIGVPRAIIQMAKPDVVEAFNKNLELMQHLGAQIIDISIPVLRYGIPTYYILATAEASANLARFDGIRYGRRSQAAKNLTQVYTKSRSEGFGAEVKQRILLGTYVLSSGYKDAYYKKAQKVRSLFIREMRAAFERIDFIATPTAPSVAFKQGKVKDPLEMYLEDLFTIPANLSGLPAISLPSGFNADKKPTGIQLIAPQFKEMALLHIAKALAQKNQYHQKIPPLFDKEA